MDTDWKMKALARPGLLLLAKKRPFTVDYMIDQKITLTLRFLIDFTSFCSSVTTPPANARAFQQGDETNASKGDVVIEVVNRLRHATAL